MTAGQARQSRQGRKPGPARKGRNDRQGRQGRQPRNRLRANRIILAVLVVVVLAALYGLVGLVKPVVLAQPGPAGQQAKLDVTSAMIGCPAPGSAGTTGGGIAVANVPSGVGTGQEVLTELNQGKTGTQVGTLPRPGQLTVERVKAAPPVPRKRAVAEKMAGGRVPTGPARGGLIVAARGANAQGLDVEQLGPGGQPTARCEPGPRTSGSSARARPSCTSRFTC